MSREPLYPLRLEPIFKAALWGGRRLGDLFGFQLLGEEPIGEAWLLSDQGESLSQVAEGPLEGMTLRQLLEREGERLLGAAANHQSRFPLLLKFINAQTALSVQVHPSDRHTQLLPPGERGKTEAWVVLHAESESRIFAGLKPAVGPDDVRRALRENTVAECLHSFAPKPGDSIFIPAGTIHAIGAGVVLFEIQQTSDVTFRLYDWGRVDAKTGQPRQLHIEQALACIDFASGPRHPIAPIVEQDKPIRRERLVGCEYFTLWRLQSQQPFSVGANDSCRMVVGIEGRGAILHENSEFPIQKGDALLLPAVVGACECRPEGALILLEAQPK